MQRKRRNNRRALVGRKRAMAVERSSWRDPFSPYPSAATLPSVSSTVYLGSPLALLRSLLFRAIVGSSFPVEGRFVTMDRFFPASRFLSLRRFREAPRRTSTLTNVGLLGIQTRRSKHEDRTNVAVDPFAELVENSSPDPSYSGVSFRRCPTFFLPNDQLTRSRLDSIRLATHPALVGASMASGK